MAKHVRNTIKDPILAEKLIPDHYLGCKRVTPHDKFLPVS